MTQPNEGNQKTAAPNKESAVEKVMARMEGAMESAWRYRTPTGTKVEMNANDQALDRTVMAADRTLMAWVRTAISLISFGFALYKFLEGVGIETMIVKRGWLSTPRGIGLTLIVMGMLCLLAAVLEYRAHMRRLGLTLRPYLWSLPVIFALAFWFVGAVALLSIVFE